MSFGNSVLHTTSVLSSPCFSPVFPEALPSSVSQAHLFGPVLGVQTSILEPCLRSPSSSWASSPLESGSAAGLLFWFRISLSICPHLHPDVKQAWTQRVLNRSQHLPSRLLSCIVYSCKPAAAFTCRKPRDLLP